MSRSKQTTFLLVFASLFLIASFANYSAYAEPGDFGTIGMAFDELRGVTVDSNNRIIVADYDHSIIQIYNSEGSYASTLSHDIC